MEVSWGFREVSWGRREATWGLTGISEVTWGPREVSWCLRAIIWSIGRSLKVTWGLREATWGLSEVTWGLRQVTLSLKVTSYYNWTITTTGGYGEVHRSLKEVKMGLRMGNLISGRLLGGSGGLQVTFLNLN